MIWKHDERYIKDIINEIDDYISRLEEAKGLLGELIGSKVSGYKAVKVLRKVKNNLGDVFFGLEGLSGMISELAVKADEACVEMLERKRREKDDLGIR